MSMLLLLLSLLLLAVSIEFNLLEANNERLQRTTYCLMYFFIIIDIMKMELVSKNLWAKQNKAIQKEIK